MKTNRSQGHEQVIGGGTFGRLLKRGALLVLCSQTMSNTMHPLTNLSDVEDLFRAAAIYAEVIYELIKYLTTSASFSG